MPKSFDSVTRFLNGLDPKSWPTYLGIVAKSVEVCNSDLSTVSTQADLLLLIDKRWALHLENESAYKKINGIRTLEYSVFSEKLLKVPVRSVLVLLRREADGPAITGEVRRCLPDGTEYLVFRYEVIRIWEIPAAKLMACGLGILPMAFIADVEAGQLPALVKQAKVRLKRETDSKTAGEIWTSIRVLMGLKYEREQIRQLLKGVRSMEESVTYQAIKEEGASDAVREILVKLGTECFDKPSLRVLAKLKKIHDKAELEDLVMRTRIVSSWAELLQ